MGKKLMRFEWDHFQPDLRPKQSRNIDFKIFDFQIFQIFPDFLDFWHFSLGTHVWRTPHIKLMGGSGVSLKKKKVFFFSSKTSLKVVELELGVFGVIANATGDFGVKKKKN